MGDLTTDMVDILRTLAWISGVHLLKHEIYLGRSVAPWVLDNLLGVVFHEHFLKALSYYRFNGQHVH